MMDSKNNPSNRQVVYFFFGFVILFIFAFSLGVIVGKGLGGSETLIINEEVPPKTPGKESREETKTETDEELKSEAPTRFSEQGEMIEAEEEANIPKTPYEPDVEPIETKKDDTTKSELLSEQPLAPSEPREEKSELETKQAQAKSTQSPTPIYERAKPEPEKEVFSKKEIAAIPTAGPQGEYTVQIGAFQKEEEARRIVNDLKARGYPAFIKAIEVPGKGIWYRVRIGRFSSREIARVYAVNLKNVEPSLKFVFVTVNN
jgi:cell division septation protein DedD